jgi:threonine dehydrogenase-like Zn-dependent dehydrogenase
MEIEMKTRAVRLHGAEDLRVDEFELPDIREDEILARVVVDSLCPSTYKAAKLATTHKRVPPDIAENPIIVGHEFCGEFVRVGAKLSGRFWPGQKFTVQPAMNYRGSMAAAGYSFPYYGGDATYIIIPPEVMETDCLFVYGGDSFFAGALAEPFSCVVGTFHAMYHHAEPGKYRHEMGIKEGGSMALLAGGGPMGLSVIEYILNCDRKPSRLIVTDIAEARLERAGEILSVEYAAERGVELKYLNTKNCADPDAELMAFSEGRGFDDVLVFAPVASLVEQADRILAVDGCLNFFAGPADPEFSARLNFFKVHYSRTHLVGTTGGNNEDMREALDMMSRGKINPAILVTHIGGLNCVPETTLNLPYIPGGKKLIYTGIDLPLTAIEDFPRLGEHNPFFAGLAEITEANNRLWCDKAEKYLLKHFKQI